MNAHSQILLARFANLAAASLDENARTIEAVVATESGVARYSYSGEFQEKLKIDANAIDLTRFIGAPVLNSHRQSSIADVIGVVESAKIEKGELRAVLRLSKDEDGEAALSKIRDGVLRSVSVGYVVTEWSDAQTKDGARIRTATKWAPMEVSLVPLAADPGAKIRGENMTTQQGAGASPSQPAAPPFATRAEINTQIRSIAKLASLGEAFANDLIDREATIEDARAAAFQQMETLSRETPIRTIADHNATSFDNPEFRARCIGEALFARSNPSHKLSDPARSFAGLTTSEIARDILRRNGVATSGMSAQALITRALHTTSDFSAILGDTANRSIRLAYSAAPSGLRMAARETTARDFRTKHRVQLAEAPTLEEVGEGGEFRHGGMSDSQETYSVSTFGRIVGISRQALVNDDLGAFTDLTRRLGQAARSFENAKLVEILETNGNMSDGNALFSAAHGNLAGSGAAPGETTLSAARLAMRGQTGLSSELISVTPKFVLVPPALETSAEKLLSTIQAATTSDVNPFASLMLLVESRLTDAAQWYVSADPAEIDGLEYAYLEGAPGPQIESRNGFEVDGVEIKVRLDFGAGFVDWRGWYANPGA